VREVLRRPAQHRRPADVDHLDGLLLADAVLPRHLLERVEVDAHEVEEADSLLVERNQVRIHLAPREDAGVDRRVKCLDAATEHLGEVGHALDTRHLQTELLDVRGGAATRDELPAK
jgi:hypothetical protein